MGHSMLQMTSRYVANNTEAHVQANQDLAKKVMFFIQSPGQSNTMESAGTECKILVIQAVLISPRQERHPPYAPGKFVKIPVGSQNHPMARYAPEFQSALK